MRETGFSRRAFLQMAGAAAGAAVLSGCREDPEPASAPEPAENTAVTVLLPGQSDAEACARISEALSAITGPKLGFAVQIEQVNTTDYSAELWNRMVCQTMPDLFLLTNAQPLDMYLNENCILPLSSLLEDHPGLKGLFPEPLWQSRTYYRRIYAIPAQAATTYQLGFLARSDWMRELGVKAEEITDLDQLHTLLTKVRQRRPNATPVLPDSGEVWPFYGLDPMGDTFGILTVDSGTKLIDCYASETYRKLCETMRQWYQEGLILRNASLRDEPAFDLMQLGNSFGFFARLNRDTLNGYTRAYGAELTAIPLGPTIRNGSMPSESWCLPVTNSKRNEVLDLLELLYTDPECYDLFASGKGAEDKLHPWQNVHLNTEGLLPEEEETPDLTSPAYGFAFNSNDVAVKVDACRALKERYHNGLTCGYLDPADALPEFLEKLEQAGIGEIISQKQRALNNWLNAVH